MDFTPPGTGCERHTNRDLVVGHSNTITPLLAALGCSETVDIPSNRYEDLFLVLPAGPGPPTLLRLTY